MLHLALIRIFLMKSTKRSLIKEMGSQTDWKFWVKNGNCREGELKQQGENPLLKIAILFKYIPFFFFLEHQYLPALRGHCS